MSGRPLGGGVGVGWGRTAWLLGLGFLALLALAPAIAIAARGHEYEPGLVIGKPCTAVPCGGGELTEPSGVAVNESNGDIYVVDEGNSRVQVFDPTGNFLFMFGGEVDKTTGANLCRAASGDVCQPGTVGIAPGQFKAPVGIAIDNASGSPSRGDVYVADNLREGPGTNVVDKFDSAGGYLNRLSGLDALGGVAVDPTGTLWLDTEGEVILGYTGAVENQPLAGPAAEREIKPPLGGFSFGANNFAVDSSEGFYVRNSDGVEARIAKVRPNPNEEVHNLVVQNKELDEEDSSAVAVESTSGVAFVDNLTSVAAFSPEGTKLEGFDFGGDLTQGAGIGLDATSGFAYVADSAAGHLLVLGPTQPGPPTVEAGNQFVSGVTSVGAELQSEVNPRSEEGEGPTTYIFEYGRCASLAACATSPYEFSTPISTLAPDFQPHPASAALTGLAPGTTYHYQVVAENSHSIGATFGAEGTFTTQAAASLALPDSRQWELVSPAEKGGGRIEGLGSIGVIQAAQGGAGVAYRANTPTSSEPSGYSLQQQLLSSRTAQGWITRDIGIPHLSVTGAGISSGAEYRFISADLALAAVQPLGPFNPTLSTEASEQTAFLHDLTESCASACYRPLVTGKDGFANVPPETHFGEGEECEPHPLRRAGVACGPEFLGATEDLSHIVLRANAALTPGGPAPGGLYEWSGGTLFPVSVLPDAEPADGDLGTNESQSARHAISGDGSRVVWATEVAGLAHLYLRINTTAPQSASGACDEAGKGCTIELDQGEGCPGCESGGGRFQIASADGSRIFFTDEKPLTEDSGAKSGSADLYECRIVSAGEALGCDLSDLTPKQGGESAAVQGSVLGAGEDASRLYFVAKGVLTQGQNAEGQEAIAGQPNLYLHDDAGTEFIATLSAGDLTDWQLLLRSQPTSVSPSGRFLEFMSQARLAGYDSRDRATGKPVAQAYLYDATTKRLHCASCEPTGARPVGYEYSSDLLASGGREVWPDALVAAIAPGWTEYSEGPTHARYQPRYLNDEGRLFFNSGDALVPQDSNGTWDVYEFEPAGVGNCTTSLPTFNDLNGGCLSLISSGSSREESAFMDASESGDDVFFLTYSRLAPQDVDNALDVYDAHVCSAESPCLPSPPAPAPACEGDACQQPATPPNDATPGSLTFNGAGNVLQCPKGKVKKGGKCVAKHKAKKHHKKKSKKHNKHKQSANSKRGADR